VRRTVFVFCLLAVLSGCSSSDERSSPYSDVNAQYGSSASSSSESSSASDNTPSGNDSSGDGFESLVSLIEEGEAIMIGSFEAEDRFDLWGCANRYSDLLAEECSSIWPAYRNTIEETDRIFSDRFPGLKAELSALVLTDEHADALRAREAYINHLRVWQERRSDFEIRFPTRVEATITDRQKLVDWFDWISEGDFAEQQDRISDTFTETCVALGNSQPANGSYSTRIRNICDN
jgi:hypothetical protein